MGLASDDLWDNLFNPAHPGVGPSACTHHLAIVTRTAARLHPITIHVQAAIPNTYSRLQRLPAHLWVGRSHGRDTKASHDSMHKVTPPLTPLPLLLPPPLPPPKPPPPHIISLPYLPPLPPIPPAIPVGPNLSHCKARVQAMGWPPVGDWKTPGRLLPPPPPPVAEPQKQAPPGPA